MYPTADPAVCDIPASRADALRPHPLNRRRWLALPFLALAGRSLATTTSPVRSVEPAPGPPAIETIPSAREPFPVIETDGDDPLAWAAEDLHEELKSEEYLAAEIEKARQAGDLAELERLEAILPRFRQDREEAETRLFALLQSRPGLEIDVSGLTPESGFIYHVGDDQGLTRVRAVIVARLVVVEPEGGDL